MLHFDHRLVSHHIWKGFSMEFSFEMYKLIYKKCMVFCQQENVNMIFIRFPLTLEGHFIFATGTVTFSLIYLSVFYACFCFFEQHFGKKKKRLNWFIKHFQFEVLRWLPCISALCYFFTPQCCCLYKVKSKSSIQMAHGGAEYLDWGSIVWTL